MSVCPTEYWLWLQCALGAGAKTDELIAYFGDPEKIKDELVKNKVKILEIRKVK